MPKTNLVIVESPAKAKTIGKYLGRDYQVIASMGHIRDLPKSKLGVDIDAGFVPNYQPIKGKEEIIAALENAAADSERVFLATDPDREGEAISWHLKELLGIPDDKTYRVTFNEITKKVVSESIKHPRALDQDLVDAQQARRILDRIVGYQLSPLLWRKVRRGLSAGRVQSVATRIVVEREQEIRAFQSQEYWTMDADAGPRRPPHGLLYRPLPWQQRQKEGGSRLRGRGGGPEGRPGQGTVSGLHGQAHPEAAPARATLHHLYSPAGGLPQAEYGAPAHYVHRPAAL